MDYILTTENLVKQYRHFKALNGLTMHIPKGSIYGFVGKNGAGKTTLIRIICGLQKPTEGGFTLYGVNSSDSNIVKARQRVGAVVETPAIYMDMTAEDNLKQHVAVLFQTLVLGRRVQREIRFIDINHGRKLHLSRAKLGF